MIRAFYGRQVFQEWTEYKPFLADRSDLPDGVILYFDQAVGYRHWYLKDMTPMLLEDVPKELLLLNLLLT